MYLWTYVTLSKREWTYVALSVIPCNMDLRQPVLRCLWTYVTLSNYGWTYVSLSNYGWTYVPLSTQPLKFGLTLRCISQQLLEIERRGERQIEGTQNNISFP